MMATIYDWTAGDTITEGLQGCTVSDEALIAARLIARDRDAPVHLFDDDGDWRVNPDGTCERIKLPCPQGGVTFP